MAIQRCPYCKAMIDEDLEYCSNCGTRLLFPEDEFIEGRENHLVLKKISS